jgi:hypothetical protein
MVCDEAPAATIGGCNGIGNATARKSARLGKRRFNSQGSGPASLVAAEIHLGRKPAGICDGWLHCNIQVACHAGLDEIFSKFSNLRGSPGILWRSLPLISGRQPKN